MVYHPEYSFEWPEKHRFKMRKFRDVREVLRQEGILPDGAEIQPIMPLEEWLKLAHCPAYISAFQNGDLSAAAMRRIGFEWSEPLVKRTLLEVSGTVKCAELALEHGMSVHLAGGTHHASFDEGAGFTILNDLAVAALVSKESAAHLRVRDVLIFDCDVHQGDGTARIFERLQQQQQQQRPRGVFTCSVHCAQNWPTLKARSHLDVPLEQGTSDAAYLATVRTVLHDLLARGTFGLVLYDAGVDVSARDALGKLELTDDGIFERDRFVFEACAQRDIPVAAVIGGGYHRDAAELAQRHAIVHRAASDVWSRMFSP